MAEFSIRYCVRTDKPKKRNGKFPIYFRVRVRDKESKIPANLDVALEFWDTKKNEPKQVLLRTALSKKREELEMYAYQIIAEGQLLTIEMLKNFNSGKSNLKPERQSFFAYFDEYIKKVEKDVEKGKINNDTLAKYKTTYRILKEYCIKKRHTSDFRICDIDYRLVEGFDLFMEEDRENSAGGRYNKHKNLKTIILDIKKHNIPINNPYLEFSIPKPGTNDVYLNTDEVEAMRKMRCKFSHSSSEYRILQMYLFSCYCGLRFSDIIDLKWSEVDFDSGFIQKMMIKTKEPVCTPIFMQAKTILLELSEGKRLLRSNNKVFHSYSSTSVNKMLVKLAEMAGINKHITFHSARHTFATLLLQEHSDIYTISKFLGHKSIEMTQRYLKNDILTLKKKAKEFSVFGKTNFSEE